MHVVRNTRSKVLIERDCGKEAGMRAVPKGVSAL